MNNKASNTIPAVRRTTQIMELLCGAKEPISQAELAHLSGTTQSSCYRILQTLVETGWVRKNHSGCYFPAAGFFSLASSPQNMLPGLQKLQPILDRLTAETGLSSKLSIRQFSEQVSVLRSESPRPVAVTGKTGARFPLIEGSVGAVLLSAESDNAIHTLAKECKLTIEEAGNSELITSRISELKQKGWVMNHSPRWQVCALSVPVFNQNSFPVAALTLIGFADEFANDKCTTLAKILKKYAKQASSLLSN